MKTFSEMSIGYRNFNDGMEIIRNYYYDLTGASGLAYQKITPFTDLFWHFRAVQCALANRGESVAHITRKYFEFAKNYLENLQVDDKTQQLIDGELNIMKLSFHQDLRRKQLLGVVEQILSLNDDILGYFIQTTGENEYQESIRNAPSEQDEQKLIEFVKKWENE